MVIISLSVVIMKESISGNHESLSVVNISLAVVIMKEFIGGNNK